jgi:hypothetical protein
MKSFDPDTLLGLSDGVFGLVSALKQVAQVGGEDQPARAVEVLIHGRRLCVNPGRGRQAG